MITPPGQVRDDTRGVARSDWTARTGCQGEKTRIVRSRLVARDQRIERLTLVRRTFRIEMALRRDVVGRGVPWPFSL